MAATIASIASRTRRSSTGAIAAAACPVARITRCSCPAVQGSALDAQPRHAEAVFGAPDLPQEQACAECKRKQKRSNRPSPHPGNLKKEREQQGAENRGHYGAIIAMRCTGGEAKF